MMNSDLLQRGLQEYAYIQCTYLYAKARRLKKYAGPLKRVSSQTLRSSAKGTLLRPIVL